MENDQGAVKRGMVCGYLRGASQHLLGGEQSSRGGGDKGGKPLPLPLPMGCGGMLGGLKGATSPTCMGGEFHGLVGV